MHCQIGGEIKALGEDLQEGEVEEIAEGFNGIQGQLVTEAGIEAGDGEAEQIIDGGAADDAPEHSTP